MKKTFLTILALVLGALIWAGVYGFNSMRAKGMKEFFASMPVPPQTVTSIVVEEEEWSPVLRAVGSTAAVQGVVVSTDQPGIVTKINFESGQQVKEGDLLVQLDATQEEAQLRSALAQQKLSSLNLQRQQNLLKSRVSSQADFDAAQAQYDQATASVLDAQSRMNKKTIKAPFSGVLGIRMVNLGQYLQSGSEVAPLQSLDPIYVNFFLPQQYLPTLAAGQPVNVRADGMPDKVFKGKINAVDSVVDEATRNVRVQATVPNPDGKLRAGMFVNAELPLPEKIRHVVVPATAVQYAPYGDTIYVIEDMTNAATGKTYRGVRQAIVKLGESFGDRVAVVDGIKPGEEVVTSGVFKLRQGAEVSVKNTILPANSNNPTPEDT